MPNDQSRFRFEREGLWRGSQPITHKQGLALITLYGDEYVSHLLAGRSAEAYAVVSRMRNLAEAMIEHALWVQHGQPAGNEHG